MDPEPPEPCYGCYVLHGQMMWCDGQCEQVPEIAFEQLRKARQEIEDLEIRLDDMRATTRATIERLEAEVSIMHTAQRRAV